MPYNNGVFSPDTAAPNVQLPQWEQFGDDTSTPDVSGFVQALKKRMQKPATPIGGSVGGASANVFGGGKMDMPQTSIGKGPMGKSGGGPSSL